MQKSPKDSFPITAKNIVKNIQCEVSTPMFAYGADQSQPEIRAATIKGLLRFWWRSLNGGKSIEKLTKTEKEIFGSTALKSSFDVAIKTPNESNFHRTALHSLTPHNNENKKKSFPPTAHFSVVFNTFRLKNRTCYSKNEINFDAATLTDLLKLFSILGGIGLRTRRGFGCFKLIDVPEEEIALTNTKSKAEYIQNLMKKNFSGGFIEINTHTDYSEIIFKPNNLLSVKKITIGHETDPTPFLQNVSRLTHDFMKKKDFLSVQKKTSHVSVSCYRFGNADKVTPVISEFNLPSDFENSREGLIAKKNNLEFIKKILPNR